MNDVTETVGSGSSPEIRIKRMNADKSRKDTGSASVYHVYFELTDRPPIGWSECFRKEWEQLHLSRNAELDGTFLVLHCEIREVASTLLPALKRALKQANLAYRQYATREALALQQREEVWQRERKEIDGLAASVSFD